MYSKQVYVEKELARASAAIALAMMYIIVLAGCTQTANDSKSEGATKMPQDTNAVQSIGTGILLQHGDQEYVVTALHVAQVCAFEPLIDTFGGWSTSTWQIIGIDQDNDIAVLQRVGENDSKIGRLAAKYGHEGTVFGSVSLALGFPGTMPPINWSRQAGQLRPIPMPVLTTLYFGTNDSHYTGGYLNYGFSGGPIVAWAGSHPTITGIITSKALTSNQSGTQEHAGLVGVSDITLAERIIAKHNNKTLEQFRDAKPKSDSGRPHQPNPVTLVTAEIMDAVVRLGRSTGG